MWLHVAQRPWSMVWKVSVAVCVEGARSQQAYSMSGWTWHQFTSKHVVALQLPRKYTFGWQSAAEVRQPPLGHLTGASEGHGGQVSSDAGQMPPNGRLCAVGMQVVEVDAIQR